MTCMCYLQLCECPDGANFNLQCYCIVIMISCVYSILQTLCECLRHCKKNTVTIHFVWTSTLNLHLNTTAMGLAPSSVFTTVLKPSRKLTLFGKRFSKPHASWYSCNYWMYCIVPKFRGSKISPNYANLCDKNFVITLNFHDSMLPHPFFNERTV